MVEKTYSFTHGGETYEVYALANANGLKMDVLTYGARIINLFVPDRNGQLLDVLVSHATPEAQCAAKDYYGATIGRFANRIGGARFTLGGREYRLEKNDLDNTLHGGDTANFDAQNWAAEIAGNSLVLRHFSPDGAGGFPGNMRVTVTFTLTEENEVVIDYFATTDKDTPCNLTNHAFFNLGGQDTVLSHELMIKARKMTPVDEQLIPHGATMDIDGTPYSFLPAKPVGKDVFSNAPLIRQCNGYDFNYCIDREGEGLEHFAYLYDAASGRRMDCYTTLPAVQLYTCCHMDFHGKKHYGDHAALCLETQGYPNSPNCPQYPSTVLKAGEEYRERTVYKFSVVN